ncbi:MAG TPA: pyridoxal phosphate-dependent aminotransferase [Polyangiaceae bacterium]|nr:pyridoxal phosphate-dependent aminotransferase [Polyangiaceae bacterium]
MLRDVFSQQTEFPNEPNQLARARTQLIRTGRPLLDLTPSNPTAVGLSFGSDWLQLLARSKSLAYDPEPFGALAARQAVAARWKHRGEAVPAEQIVLSASTSEAYSHLFKLLCNPGDEVLVPQPSYPLFEHLARLEHVHLAGYRLGYDGSWYIDLDSLRRAQTTRTKAVILVSPNNPTGSIVNEDELKVIAALGLPVISDEVFSTFLFGKSRTRYESAIGIDSTLVFVLDGLSKSLGLPQCKLAWTSVVGPKGLVEQALSRIEIIADAFLSVATPIQYALPELLEDEHDRHSVIISRLEQNLNVLEQLVRGSAATALATEGGWSAVLQLPSTRTESEWVLTLLEQDGVWLQPGWFFDFERESFVVVSLLTPSEDFKTGIERLVRRVNRE